MTKHHPHWIAIAIATLILSSGFSWAQQPAQGPPPSVASEPPPEPGADELNAAARKGDVAAVKALLDKGISPDAKWRYGMTALFPACDRGHVEVVRLLLERGANPNSADRFYNATPIAWALNKGHADIAFLLLQKGAPNSQQVLDAGVGKGHAELVRASLAKGGLQPFALTAALLRATRDNKKEIVGLLEAGGAKLPPTVAPEVLAQYVGNYTSPQDPDGIAITLKDGELMGSSGPQVFHLFAEDEVSFRPLEFPGMVAKFVKEGGAVVRIDLVQGPRTTPYKKAEVKP